MNNHAVVYSDPRPTLSRWRGYNSPNFFRPITQAQGRPQLLVPSDNPNEINIQGPIVDQLSAERYRWWYETDYFVSDLEFKTALDATTGSLVILNINSPGGTGYVAAAIRSYIQKARETKGKRFEARILGLAASAATLIACSCDDIVMNDVATYMIHRASIGYDFWGQGNYDDLRLIKGDVESLMQEVKELDDALTAVYVQKTGATEQDIREMMRAETFMNVTTALEKGFVDRVQSTGLQKPTAHNQPTANHLPRGIQYSPAAGLVFADPSQRPPSPTTPEIVTMHEDRIRKDLGLADGTQITQEHRDLWASKLIQREEAAKNRNKELEETNAKNAKESLIARARNELLPHVERGALTANMRDQYIKELEGIDKTEDAEARLKFYTEFLADIKDDAHVPTDPQGSAKRNDEGDPEGGDGGDTQVQAPTTDEERADQFKAQYDKELERSKGEDIMGAMISTENHFVKKFGRIAAQRMTRAYNASRKYARQDVLNFLED